MRFQSKLKFFQIPYAKKMSEYSLNIPYIEDYFEPENFQQYADSLMEAVEAEGIELKKGDLVRSEENDYRNDGVLIFDGQQLRDLDAWPDDYGVLPKEFAIPEFLPGNIELAHNNYIWLNTREVTWLGQFGKEVTPGKKSKGGNINRKEDYAAYGRPYGWAADFKVKDHKFRIHQFCLEERDSYREEIPGYTLEERARIVPSDGPYLFLDPWCQAHPLWQLIRDQEQILVYTDEDLLDSIGARNDTIQHLVLYNALSKEDDKEWFEARHDH